VLSCDYDDSPHDEGDKGGSAGAAETGSAGEEDDGAGSSRKKRKAGDGKRKKDSLGPKDTEAEKLRKKIGKSASRIELVEPVIPVWRVWREVGSSELITKQRSSKPSSRRRITAEVHPPPPEGRSKSRQTVSNRISRIGRGRPLRRSKMSRPYLPRLPSWRCSPRQLRPRRLLPVRHRAWVLAQANQP
jgi:hypothetical protein